MVERGNYGKTDKTQLLQNFKEIEKGKIPLKI
jgi:hypothetical protein